MIPFVALLPSLSQYLKPKSMIMPNSSKLAILLLLVAKLRYPHPAGIPTRVNRNSRQLHVLDLEFDGAGGGVDGGQLMG